jgi:hypothetical protein
VDEGLGELVDQFMADGFTLHAFMLQVAYELAKKEPDPEAWAKSFVSSLHEWVDVNEGRMGARGQKYPVHEIARHRIDRLGHELTRLLGRPQS